MQGQIKDFGKQILACFFWLIFTQTLQTLRGLAPDFGKKLSKGPNGQNGWAFHRRGGQTKGTGQNSPVRWGKGGVREGFPEVRSLMKMKLFKYHKLNEKVVFKRALGLNWEDFLFCW